MEKCYPVGYAKALAQLIRDGNRQGFIDLRYPCIQEAEPFVFEDENFQNTDITKFPATHNFCYVHCDFRYARLNSGNCSMRIESKDSESDVVTGLSLMSATFIECDMRKINLSSLRAASCIFTKCNLSGAVWSEHTRFGWPATSLSCFFAETVLDPNFREFLEKQGVKFGMANRNMLDRRCDVSENCIFESQNQTDLIELQAHYPE